MYVCMYVCMHINMFIMLWSMYVCVRYLYPSGIGTPRVYTVPGPGLVWYIIYWSAYLNEFFSEILD